MVSSKKDQVTRKTIKEPVAWLRLVIMARWLVSCAGVGIYGRR